LFIGFAIVLKTKEMDMTVGRYLICKTVSWTPHYREILKRVYLVGSYNVDRIMEEFPGYKISMFWPLFPEPQTIQQIKDLAKKEKAVFLI
jgi:5-formyltetrahydrofolate cyclo-ligase